jgi:hypothetical protein
LKLALVSGLAAFLALTGGGVILDPRNTDWLFLENDSVTSFVGWQFFRQAPLVQWPLGANPAFGLEIGSSVVFSDSIPLVALLLKPFSPLLPATFQYFGLWILASFVLQSVFAYLLLARFTPDRWLALAGSVFFTLAPVCLARLYAPHYALFAQWLLLAALYLYFAPRYAARGWLLLLGATTLVHFYLLFMVALIWCADLWQRRWRGETTLPRAAATLAGGIALMLGLMWLAGYFMLGDAVGECCFGQFAMNVLSPFDPDKLWSRVLPDLPGVHHELEAFNYLGSGILVLLVAAALPLWPRRAGVLERPSLVPLLALSLGLVVLALSNRVAVGSFVLLEWRMPGAAATLADALRSSARMFWPVYYLIYLAVLVSLLRRLSRPAALALCAGAFALQLAESSAALKHVHRRFVYPEPVMSPLRSALWKEIGTRYKRVTYVLPRNAMDTHFPWTSFAVEHGMSVNYGYFARVNLDRVHQARDALENAILRNALDPDSLYVFENLGLWRVALAQVRPPHVAGVLDGYRILAPGLADCASCDLADVRADPPVPYTLGERISFAERANGERFIGGGWYWPDERGRWSVSWQASLVVELGPRPARDLMLSIEGHAFVNALLPRQEIDLLANGTPVATLVYTSPAPETKTVTLPRAVLAQSAGPLLIQLRFRNVKSRHELGWSDDRHRLGLYLVSMRLTDP